MQLMCSILTRNKATVLYICMSEYRIDILVQIRTGNNITSTHVDAEKIHSTSDV